MASYQTEKSREHVKAPPCETPEQDQDSAVSEDIQTCMPVKTKYCEECGQSLGSKRRDRYVFECSESESNFHIVCNSCNQKLDDDLQKCPICDNYGGEPDEPIVEPDKNTMDPIRLTCDTGIKISRAQHIEYPLVPLAKSSQLPKAKYIQTVRLTFKATSLWTGQTPGYILVGGTVTGTGNGCYTEMPYVQIFETCKDGHHIREDKHYPMRTGRTIKSGVTLASYGNYIFNLLVIDDNAYVTKFDVTKVSLIDTCCMLDLKFPLQVLKIRKHQYGVFCIYPSKIKIYGIDTLLASPKPKCIETVFLDLPNPHRHDRVCYNIFKQFCVSSFRDNAVYIYSKHGHRLRVVTETVGWKTKTPTMGYLWQPRSIQACDQKLIVTCQGGDIHVYSAAKNDELTHFRHSDEWSMIEFTNDDRRRKVCDSLHIDGYLFSIGLGMTRLLVYKTELGLKKSDAGVQELVNYMNNILGIDLPCALTRNDAKKPGFSNSVIR